MIAALIKAIVLSLIVAPIFVFIILVIIALGYEWLFGPLSDTATLVLGVILILLSYPLSVIGLFSNYKEKATCPRCKEPFVWYEEKEGTETLSEDYISQDVKDSEGIYRRKSYRIGKERDYYRSTCKECGYTETRTEVGSFKREV